MWQNVVKHCCICNSSTKVCNTPIGLLCRKHYLQYKRHGKILNRTKYDSNEIKIDNDIAIIFLYNKDGE